MKALNFQHSHIRGESPRTACPRKRKGIIPGMAQAIVLLVSPFPIVIVSTRFDGKRTQQGLECRARGVVEPHRGQGDWMSLAGGAGLSTTSRAPIGDGQLCRSCEFD